MLNSNNVYLHYCQHCIYFHKTPPNWYKKPKFRCEIHKRFKAECKDKITKEEIQHARRTL